MRAHRVPNAKREDSAPDPAATRRPAHSPPGTWTGRAQPVTAYGGRQGESVLGCPIISNTGSDPPLEGSGGHLRGSGRPALGLPRQDNAACEIPSSIRTPQPSGIRRAKPQDGATSKTGPLPERPGSRASSRYVAPRSPAAGRSRHNITKSPQSPARIRSACPRRIGGILPQLSVIATLY